jgi:hypothetical protein
MANKSEYDVHPNMALLAVWGHQKDWYEHLRAKKLIDIQDNHAHRELISQTLRDMYETAKAIKGEK